MTTIATIHPRELAELGDSSEVQILDVRTPIEFQDVHAVGARNVPLDKLDVNSLIEEQSGSIDSDSTDSDSTGSPLYIICQSGGRSRSACQKFIDAGFTNVVNVSGGTLAWNASGLPVVRGKKSVSLERQVRIAAGLLILTGIGLSFFHPYWIGLSAFVGAGLVFAGITDTCGMGIMLSKMPWNQVKSCETK